MTLRESRSESDLDLLRLRLSFESFLKCRLRLGSDDELLDDDREPLEELLPDELLPDDDPSLLSLPLSDDS
jgi:hypothetical protein